MSTTGLVLPVVDSQTCTSHLINLDVAAVHRHSGRYPALCDASVIAASLITSPARDCSECRALAQQHAAENSLPRDPDHGRLLPWPRRKRSASSGAHRKPRRHADNSNRGHQRRPDKGNECE